MWANYSEEKAKENDQGMKLINFIQNAYQIFYYTLLIIPTYYFIQGISNDK